MNKLYLDMSVVSSVPDAYRQDSAFLMRTSGMNIGNYAFRHGLASIVDLSDTTLATYSDMVQKSREISPDVVLVSCANWLSNTPDYERSNGDRATLIESLSAPVISFGLGAQASGSDHELKLGPNTIRLAKVLSEKSKCFSVRDEYTASVLERIGISNFRTTGCPSNFINLDRKLGSAIIARATDRRDNIHSWDGVRAHISELSGGHALSSHVMTATLDIIDSSSSFYIIQSPALASLLLIETNDLPAQYAADASRSRRSEFQLKSLLKRSMLHFSSIDGWLDFARTCDLAFGMRIHGNMIPLQAGVPSLLIGHDSRTLGLAGYMNIPFMTPSEFLVNAKAGPESMFNRIAETMGNYDSRRQKLAKIMAEVLTLNDLPMTAAFERFL